MVKLRGPLNNTEARGWVGRRLYHRHGVVASPYPISFLGKIHIPYPFPAFATNPYSRFIAQYYSVKGWCYQQRRTWHGIQPMAMHPPDHQGPYSPAALAGQVAMSEAVSIWLAMPQTVKDIYNVWRHPVHASGYHRFISWYLLNTPHMPIYWGTLQRALGDPELIPTAIDDKIATHTAIKTAHHSNKAAIVLDIDNGASVITTGIKADIRIPFSCTIKSWQLFADVAGDIVIDIWGQTYINFPPVDGDSICAGHEPTLSAVNKNKDDTAAGFTTALLEGDVLRFNVDSIATIKRIHLSIGIEIT